ncbi:MAG: mannose-1-phosphate guanylyltransferase [Bacteroidales bacterium]|nr:mannose-1-phosphate guanylyltransferase [Bacteroidales bacterium]
MANERYCVIMAGGIGSRFWPLSKDDHPKQFIDVLGTGKSFIRATFERFIHDVPVENFLVVTNVKYKQLVLEHLPELREDQVLCEPMRRNTAPCIAYANYRIRARRGQASIVVTPADHLVTNEAEFMRVMRTGFDFLETPQGEDALLTIGIKPSRPETGYGYIQTDSNEEVGIPTEVKRVASFKEKPDLQTAKRYVEDGHYLWNSGIFLWTLQGILKAYQSHLPELTRLFDEGKEIFGTSQEWQFIHRQFPRCENISIDYGVMERAKLRYCIPADFGWSDIGTWGSLYEHVPHDANGNALRGNVTRVQTSRSIVNVEDGVQAIVQGLDGYLVAFRDKSLLVCRMEDEQRIKEWVDAQGKK